MTTVFGSLATCTKCMTVSLEICLKTYIVLTAKCELYRNVCNSIFMYFIVFYIIATIYVNINVLYSVTDKIYIIRIRLL